MFGIVTTPHHYSLDISKRLHYYFHSSSKIFDLENLRDHHGEVAHIGMFDDRLATC